MIHETQLIRTFSSIDSSLCRCRTADGRLCYFAHLRGFVRDERVNPARSRPLNPLPIVNGPHDRKEIRVRGSFNYPPRCDYSMKQNLARAATERSGNHWMLANDTMNWATRFKQRARANRRIEFSHLRKRFKVETDDDDLLQQLVI